MMVCNWRILAIFASCIGFAQVFGFIDGNAFDTTLVAGLSLILANQEKGKP